MCGTSPIQWTCDHCGGPLVGAIFYPRIGGQRWCEDCAIDEAAEFTDHRTFTAQFIDDRSLASSGRGGAAEQLCCADSAASLVGGAS